MNIQIEYFLASFLGSLMVFLAVLGMVRSAETSGSVFPLLVFIAVFFCGILGLEAWYYRFGKEDAKKEV
jgi:glycerol uptake facilitator-like aquaporin